MAVNDSGLIVGTADTSDGSSQAFSDIGGVMTHMGTLGGSFSIASDVNNFGQIVGDSTLADNLYENPFSYEGGVMTDLNLATSAANNDLRSLFLAFSINDDGQIVGEALNNLGEDVAFFLTPTSVAPTQTLRDNGPPAQTVSDMSNSGLLLSLGFAGLSILSQSTRVRRKRGESGDIAD